MRILTAIGMDTLHGRLFVTGRFFREEVEGGFVQILAIDEFATLMPSDADKHRKQTRTDEPNNASLVSDGLPASGDGNRYHRKRKGTECYCSPSMAFYPFAEVEGGYAGVSFVLGEEPAEQARNACGNSANPQAMKGSALESVSILKRASQKECGDQ